MGAKETATAGVVATSVMTAFSYAVSALEKENYKEPALLSVFMQRLTGSHHPLINVSGWPAHYSLGIVWAGVYALWAGRLRHRSSLKQGLLFGLFSGTVGVLIWRMMFLRIPDPPATDRKRFYRQLLMAHILFSLTLSKNLPLPETQITGRG